MADLMDFMNNFIDSGDSNIDEEMFALEQKYSSKFGHGIPREMFPPSIEDSQIKDAVKKCLESNQDNLFELLGVTVDNRNLY